jgi:hypothetical protein
MITLTREEAQQVLDIVKDAVVYGTGITKDGKRIDPASIYKEPEPVAWEYCGALFYDKEEVFAWHERGDIGSTPPKPLYTAPPQREWQGLTDEEIKDILDCGRPNLINIKKAEQKLKEKNT